jgi:hypothetical protein
MLYVIDGGGTKNDSILCVGERKKGKKLCGSQEHCHLHPVDHTLLPL